MFGRIAYSKQPYSRSFIQGPLSIVSWIAQWEEYKIETAIVSWTAQWEEYKIEVIYNEDLNIEYNNDVIVDDLLINYEALNIEYNVDSIIDESSDDYEDLVINIKTETEQLDTKEMQEILKIRSPPEISIIDQCVYVENILINTLNQINENNFMVKLEILDEYEVTLYGSSDAFSKQAFSRSGISSSVVTMSGMRIQTKIDAWQNKIENLSIAVIADVDIVENKMMIENLLIDNFVNISIIDQYVFVDNLFINIPILVSIVDDSIYNENIHIDVINQISIEELMTKIETLDSNTKVEIALEEVKIMLENLLINNFININISDQQLRSLTRRHQLIGSKNTEFYIKGSKDTEFYLEGNIEIAKKGQDFEIFEGEDIILHIHNVKNLDELGDLYSVQWRVLESPESENVLIAKDLDGGIELEDNHIIITLDAEDTQELGGNRYYHEVRIKQTITSGVATLTIGTLKINASGFVGTDESNEIVLNIRCGVGLSIIDNFVPLVNPSIVSWTAEWEEYEIETVIVSWIAEWEEYEI